MTLLVATSVAEEGLDIRQCNVVIRFDLAKTVLAYIQSRGRARKPAGSDYILMAERYLPCPVIYVLSFTIFNNLGMLENKCILISYASCSLEETCHMKHFYGMPETVRRLYGKKQSRELILVILKITPD